VFARLNDAIDTHGRVLGSTDVAGLLALSGREVVDSGQSEYFAFALSDRSLPWLVPAATIQARWDSFMATLTTDISERRYDLVIRSRRWGPIPQDLVGEHYRRIETLDIDFAWSGQRWPVDVWEPIARGAPAAAPSAGGPPEGGR
jgi:hypothetical protein